MLANQAEMVGMNNDGTKSIESSLTASKEAVSCTDGKATKQERPRNIVSSLINQQKLGQMRERKKQATARVHNSWMLMDQKSKKKEKKADVLELNFKGHSEQRQ